MESLSPHRILSTDEERPLLDGRAQGRKRGQFDTMILDNLKKAGVQNTVKNERLTSLTAWNHTRDCGCTPKASIRRLTARSRRVAISIGPEHGTVGPQLVKEAAKEAVQGVGFDLLVVCGFAFDPHVAEEAKRYGKLTVLPGPHEPRPGDGRRAAKEDWRGQPLHGLRRAGPDHHAGRRTASSRSRSRAWTCTTRPPAQIRSSSTDDIACWFIDTDYNGESFFVRHAYFTGADEPYEKLKRALRADIDEAAWAHCTPPEPPLRRTRDRQDCREGHQPLWGRSVEGFSGWLMALRCGDARRRAGMPVASRPA